MNKVLWVEDQFEDLMDYSIRLGKGNYFVDPVKSVSEALDKLQNEKYAVYIFDLKILPGDNLEWQALDDKKREENPHFDPYLGLELLRFLNKSRQENHEIWQKIQLDFSKVVVFSVVNDDKVNKELKSFGIPRHQIIYKSDSDLDTLPKLIMELQNQEDEEDHAE